MNDTQKEWILAANHAKHRRFDREYEAGKAVIGKTEGLFLDFKLPVSRLMFDKATIQAVVNAAIRNMHDHDAMNWRLSLAAFGQPTAMFRDDDGAVWISRDHLTHGQNPAIISCFKLCDAIDLPRFIAGQRVRFIRDVRYNELIEDSDMMHVEIERGQLGVVEQREWFGSVNVVMDGESVGWVVPCDCIAVIDLPRFMVDFEYIGV